MKKRRCTNCGKDISYQPAYHYLCYECWRQSNVSLTFCDNSKDEFESFDNNTSNFPKALNPDSGIYETHNDVYEKRYKGDSDYDMGPNWDYDEYPPENL
jgi:predicted amidophosphoribosyltransferase